MAKNLAQVTNMEKDFREADLFTWGKHFLPMSYLALMAKEMTATGRRKAAAGQRKYDNWTVTIEDILQWIDCGQGKKLLTLEKYKCLYSCRAASQYLGSVQMQRI